MTLPLSALLSQLLVAFTVELDNEFERRMAEAGQTGSPVSLVVWLDLMRFLTGDGVAVRDLAKQALAPEKGIKFELGCLERWRFVVLEGDPADERPIPRHPHRLSGRLLRDGWGSGRGIRSGWIVRLTDRGRTACEIWTPLLAAIERRWQGRFGEDEIAALRQALEKVAGQIDVELPYGLPAIWEAPEEYPPRNTRHHCDLPLPVLLSRLLLAFTVEFSKESRTPLVLCANTLRVLGEKPIPEADIPRLTGGSPETAGIGWQIKPYIIVEPDPNARRGKVVRLSPLGVRVQQSYRESVEKIELRWEEKFGKSTIRGLRKSLEQLLAARSGGRALLAEGLVPAEGTLRAGHQRPALGRGDVGSAARQRMRDLVVQTEMFQRDPAGSLPHYPLWDMNRGFGP
jgi:DNA-binding MarR family transcriptional regulator